MLNMYSPLKNQPCDGGDWPLPWDLTNLRRHGFPALVFFFLLVLIYGASFDCSWHFDDYANIVNNPNIHINNLSWNQVEKSLHGILDSGRWSRPLSYLSFALNYYFHGLEVFGYHVINLTIHYFATFFLYLFIFNTLKLPVFNGRYKDNAYSIAILGAVLWSINPVQVSAGTYIVQRSTSMAALFYIMAMYLYLKGRTTDHLGWMRTVLFLSSLLMGLMAIGTKENAAVQHFSLRCDAYPGFDVGKHQEKL